MRLHSGLDNAQLIAMLQDCLVKEQKFWSPGKGLKNDVEVGPEQRDDMVKWLARLTDKFQFYPETFALSVSILDRFLHTVKARCKYLPCIAISSFYLAAKTLEEDEVIPRTVDLCVESQCGCTVAEVLRMERLILDKLHWDVRAVTAVDFLHIFHALLLSGSPHLLDKFSRMTPSRQLSLLTTKLRHCLAHHPVVSFKPSTLALALLSLELELCTGDWLPMTIMMQNLVKIDNQQLIRCREVISRHLASSRHINTLYIYTTSMNRQSTKRKVDQLEEVDDIYDSIKKLYNEEEVPVTTCGSEARDGDDICAGLPSVTAN